MLNEIFEAFVMPQYIPNPVSAREIKIWEDICEKYDGYHFMTYGALALGLFTAVSAAAVYPATTIPFILFMLAIGLCGAAVGIGAGFYIKTKERFLEYQSLTSS